MSTLFGQYLLKRFPLTRNEKLRAWDAADELVLDHIYKHNPLAERNTKDSAQVLLINDGFGALSVALNEYLPDNWSDSVTAHFSTSENLKLNALKNIKLIESTKSPSKLYGLIVIKLPKSLALLEHQLIEIRRCMTSTTTVIAAGMIKHSHKSQLALFEKYIGKTHTSLAKKKARLVFATPDNRILSKNYLSPFPFTYQEKSLGLSLSNHANVFSHDKLDIGTRFILAQFEVLPRANTIVDLGCGNGILGIKAATAQKEKFGINSKIHFVDESYMALESAKINFFDSFDKTVDSFESPEFHENISLEDIELRAVDLIICNPPFHQNHTITDHIAKAMIANSQRMLGNGGVMWLVGNRHLDYPAKMKRIFGNCQLIAGNTKFVVLTSSVSKTAK